MFDFVAAVIAASVASTVSGDSQRRATEQKFRHQENVPQPASSPGASFRSRPMHDNSASAVAIALGSYVAGTAVGEMLAQSDTSYVDTTSTFDSGSF